MLKFSVFLDLSNEVFVERNLELRRKLDFVRLDHLHLDRRDLDLDGLLSLGCRDHSFRIGRSVRGRGNGI